jgi:hypothetical protein
MSKACPLLEEIDFATVHKYEDVGVRPSSGEMTTLPALFPNLKKISLEMIRCDSDGLEQFIQAMDGRLVHLQFVGQSRIA